VAAAGVIGALVFLVIRNVPALLAALAALLIAGAAGWIALTRRGAARILAAVDCLDALATDRQYRKALPLDDAMRWVADQAGKAYDPKVVAVLQAHYKELEEIVLSQSVVVDRQKLSTGLKVQRGSAPASGFQVMQ